jgi:hypothetical protein
MRAWGFDAEIVASVPFTVGKVVKEGNISLDKTAYTAMEPIVISYSGITQNMVNSKAMVVMYEKGAAHDKGLEFSQEVTQSSGTIKTYARNQNGEFEIRLYTVRGVYNDDTFVTSVPFTVSGATASEWAQGELEKANELGLIPDSFKGKDLTKPITRAEFAAVGVKLYEALTGKTATPVAANPFSDTNDPEVLKAKNIDIVAGIGGTDKYEPDRILNRQEAAHLLTNVIKKISIPEWTNAANAQFTLKYDKPAQFADDANIDGWAKDSVYFMVANKIITGYAVGSGFEFRPKNTTQAEEAMNYANATREAALIIAVRAVENLKDKPLDFQAGAAAE